MRILLTVVLILFVLAAPVAAYNVTHQFEMKLDGEWDFQTTFVTDGFENRISLKGVGLAEMYSLLEVSPISKDDMLWWSLF